MTGSESSPEEGTVKVSIVVITKNEAPRIRACLDSVMTAAQLVGPAEVVLVDSRSSDGTVEIARDYPIKIFVLGPSQPCSPAAGYYIGTINTTGELVLYLNGDMAVNPQWLQGAVRFMDAHKEYGALSGRLLEIGPERIGLQYSPFDVFSAAEAGFENMVAKDVDRFFGPVLVRRTSLIRAGGWNPYLTGDEEEELSYRLLTSGFRIGSTEEPMALHLNPVQLTLREVIRRLRRGYSKGQGKVLKASMRQGWRAFLHHAWRLKLYLAYDAWLMVGVALCFLFALGGGPVATSILFLWLAAALATVVVESLHHGLRQTLIRMISNLVLGISMLQGLLEKLPRPEEYPTEAVRVK